MGDGLHDAFVVKLNPAGGGQSDLLYATFLGGNSTDWGSAIAVDGSGSAYVTGWTKSPDFPTTPGAFDTTHSIHNDVFVVRLRLTGSGQSDLLYATFLGGEDYDNGRGIAVDETGNVYVTGETYSFDFPTTPGAFDTDLDGCEDAFVVKLNPASGGQSDLLYATFLGGEHYDEGRGIAVDGASSAYVAGCTYSSDFPATPGAYDEDFSGGSDAFVVAFKASALPGDQTWAVCECPFTTAGRISPSPRWAAPCVSSAVTTPRPPASTPPPWATAGPTTTTSTWPSPTTRAVRWEL
jgi:hypothetical protein